MIVVTGGTGLIGSHLLYELALKYNYIRAIKRPESNLNNVKKIFYYYSDKSNELFQRIEWVNAELKDSISIQNALKEMQYVYHSAGLVSFDRRLKHELYRTNAEGTANVVNASLQMGIKKICHVSSIAIFGESDEDNLITEKTKWKPDKKSSVYSLSKFKAEMEIWRGIAEGLQAVIVNPSVVIGPGFWQNGLGTAISMVKKGIKYYTEGATGYVDVRDVARIMIQLMESDISGEQYILSSDNFTFKEILDALADLLGTKNASKLASKSLMNIAWKSDFIRSVLTGKMPALTRDNAKIAHKKCYYSNRKITNTLDYQFISVIESLRFVVEKFLFENNSK